MANKAIGTLGTIDSLTIGGTVFTDLTNIIVLTGGAFHTTNIRSTFRKAAGAGYQVTAGKTLTCRAAQCVVAIAEASTYVGIYYQDTDTGQLNTTAPTNPVYYGSNNTTSTAQIVGIFDTNSTGIKERAIWFGIAAQKYGGVYFSGSTGSGSVTLYGYEA